MNEREIVNLDIQINHRTNLHGDLNAYGLICQKLNDGLSHCILEMKEALLKIKTAK